MDLWEAVEPASCADTSADWVDVEERVDQMESNDAPTADWTVLFESGSASPAAAVRACANAGIVGSLAMAC